MLELASMRSAATQLAGATNGFRDPSFGKNKPVSIHRWVPWIAGFSADFVSDCLRTYLPGQTPHNTWVLDPFSGVGTTLVEAYLQGRNVVGFEINPYAALAARVKLEAARISERRLADQITSFEKFMRKPPANGASLILPRTLPPTGFQGRTQFFSPKVERKALFALDFMNSVKDKRIRDVFRLAFGSVMVSFSNYTYEPSLTRRVAVGKAQILDHDVGLAISEKLTHMLDDIIWLRDHIRSLPVVPKAELWAESIFSASSFLKKRSFVDLVVTSPPYLNNYHYPRNTRPQVHWLGMGSGNGYASARENDSFGRFWQTVRDLPPIGLDFDLPGLKSIIDKIRKRNIEREAYGGPGWANYAATYFNDTLRFCNVLRSLLKPGGAAVIVLGNSVIQGVEVRTDQWFGEIAELCDLEFEKTLMLRTKRTGSSIIQSSVRVDSAADKVVLYESAIVLRK